MSEQASKQQRQLASPGRRRECLLVARAAKEGRPCPSDEALAATYGTSSLGRVRRLIGYIESRDLFVTRVDLSGKRSIAIPRLGWTTEPAEAA